MIRLVAVGKNYQPIVKSNPQTRGEENRPFKMFDASTRSKAGDACLGKSDPNSLAFVGHRASPALLPGEPVERIRREWPDVQIIVRADVGV